MRTSEHGDSWDAGVPGGLQDLVSQALTATSHGRRPADVADALSRAGGEVGSALLSLDVPVSCFERAPADILTRIAASAPALARDGANWLLLDERRGGRLRVTDTREHRWVREEHLEQLQLRDWVLLPPAPVFPASGTSPSPLQRIRSLMTVEAQDLLTVLLYAIGVALLSLATPVAVQALVNSVAFGTAMQPLLVLTILLAAGLGLAAGLQLLQVWVVEMLRRRLFVRLLSDLTHRLPRVRAQALRGGRGPELLNRFFDIFTLEKAVAAWLGDGIGALITSAVGLAVLAVYHPALLVFDLLLGAAVAAIFLGLGRGGTKTAIKESKAKYAVAAWLEEIARHPVAFKAAGAAGLARSRADALGRDFLAARQAHFGVVVRQLAGALGLQVFAAAGLLGVGGWLVLQRQLTLGQLVAAELIVASTVAAFAKSSKLLESWYDMLAAVDKLGQLTDLPLEDGREKTDELPPGPLSVRFTVGGQMIAVQPGERVGLTGRSWLGKSTALEGLFGIGDGDAVLGELPVRELDRTLVRSRVALVQGSEVIDGSILDNLRFGRSGPSRSEAWELLRRVGVGGAVAQLEDGLDTPLTPTGAPLVPSAARRLLVARALVGQPQLLLLDESLDGLAVEGGDPALDAALPEARSWTVIAVSHDPAVLARCDRVVGFDPSLETR